jgi:Uma2 family endonuclease
VASTQPTFLNAASIPRFTVARYQRMIENGDLTPDDKVELLENYVVLKVAKNPPHDGTIDLVKAALGAALPPGWMLRVQQAIELSDSQPEPDVGVVRGNPRSFLTRHPTPADVGLVVEVADSSLLRDQRDKTRIYARAAVACYWIVNLVDGRVEVYTNPSGPTATPSYAAAVAYSAGDAVPLVLDGVQVAAVPVADLLP